MTSPIRRTGQFNRLSFYAHIEEIKDKIQKEGGPKAYYVLPVLVRLQIDIDKWTADKRYKKAYRSIFFRKEDVMSGPDSPGVATTLNQKEA